MTARLDAAIRELVEAIAEAARMEAAASPATPDRLYSVAEAADALGLGRSALYAELGAGRLRSFRIGRRRLIPAAAVAEFIQDRVA
jgi:excisionase family DNA binding protein